MGKLAILLLCIQCCFPVFASNKEAPVAFTATPERCVALHKGQMCYQDVLFQWKTPEIGDYCLVQSLNQTKLVCWEGGAMQQYQYSFKGDKTTAFSLIRSGEQKRLALAKVVVTWVYKAPKQSQSGWRLF